MNVAVVPGFDEIPMAGYMAKEPASIGFAFDPIMPRAAVTLLGGHGGAGKSMLALSFLAHGACGVPFASFVCAGELRGVYVTFEDEGARVIDRLRVITAAHNLDDQLVEQNLRILDATRAGVPLAVEENEFGRRALHPTHLLSELLDAAKDVDLIVVDNASDSFDGDENARRQVRAFIRMLTDVARSSGCALVLLAHIDKVAARAGARGQTYSGSTQWNNSVRSRLALVDDDSGGVTLRHEKSNFCATAAAVTLRRDDDGVPIPNGDAAAAYAHDDDAAALRMLQQAAEAGECVPVAVSGPRTTAAVLARFPAAARFPDSVGGRKRMNAALDRLRKEGRVDQVGYKDEHRNARVAWQIIDVAVAAEEPGARSLVPPLPHNDKRTHHQPDACVRQLDNYAESDRTDELTHVANVDDARDQSARLPFDPT